MSAAGTDEPDRAALLDLLRSVALPAVRVGAHRIEAVDSRSLPAVERAAATFGTRRLDEFGSGRSRRCTPTRPH